jgi:hypothetical protein
MLQKRNINKATPAGNRDPVVFDLIIKGLPCLHAHIQGQYDPQMLIIKHFCDGVVKKLLQLL